MTDEKTTPNDPRGEGPFARGDNPFASFAGMFGAGPGAGRRNAEARAHARDWQREAADFARGLPAFGGMGPRLENKARARMGRGHVRFLLLAELAKGPKNGYQLIQALSSSANEMWKPSPGTVYPALGSLQEEGLVTASEDGTYTVTEAGTAFLKEKEETVNKVHTFFEEVSKRAPIAEAAHKLQAVVMEASRVGGNGVDEKIVETLNEARRSIYRFLAED